jgi:hypothetical protein
MQEGVDGLLRERTRRSPHPAAGAGDRRAMRSDLGGQPNGAGEER